jgi:hypothetical protein
LPGGGLRVALFCFLDKENAVSEGQEAIEALEAKLKAAKERLWGANS